MRYKPVLELIIKERTVFLLIDGFHGTRHHNKSGSATEALNKIKNRNN